MKLTLYCSLVILLIVSCKHLERLELKDYPLTPISKENYRELNGTYSNMSDTACGTYRNDKEGDSTFNVVWNTLITTLITHVPDKAYSFKQDSAGNILKQDTGWVKLEFTSSKSLTLSFYRNDKFIFSEIIRGKFKKGYFYRSPRWYFAPFIPLFFAYKNEQVRIGKSGNQLVVDYYLNNWGIFFIAGGAMKECSKSVYQIKKDE